MSRTATAVWTISPELVIALDERLGPPVDSYVNGSQTWFAGDEDVGEAVLEFRLHPVAGYRTPKGASHYEVWETVVAQLSVRTDPHALRVGEEVRPLAGLWDGLECYAAYGDELEPPELVRRAVATLGVAPERSGLVDHESIGDAWEKAKGKVSIVALLLAQLEH